MEQPLFIYQQSLDPESHPNKTLYFLFINYVVIIDF